ncbi:MAG: dihydroorotate dehydrogenase [Clostridiales bacterium]|nr:dihydroorotate dehydrogenase [Clostridiales bacterium]
MNIKTEVNIGGLELQNPVIAASGTFGFGREYGEYIDLNSLGAISVKGLTLRPREGNLPPRIAETPSGILNSVGLQNPGVHAFIQEEIPFLRRYRCKIIANVAGSTVEEYEEMAEILSSADIDAIELNLSCPNVKAGCAAFGTSAAMIKEVTRRVKNKYNGPLFVKLTPNVTSISELALAAEEGGADAVSLINTLLGMAIDIHTRRPILANNTGGLSGPAIKPVALRMVNEVYRTVKIPIIGMGGISTGDDAIEFLLAGASAIMVGTASFVNPRACLDVFDDVLAYMKNYNIRDIASLTGSLRLN